MNFKEKLKEFIHSLVATKEYPGDVALERLAEILKETKTERKLKKNATLVSRIYIDSAENWNTIKKRFFS